MATKSPSPMVDVAASTTFRQDCDDNFARTAQRGWTAVGNLVSGSPTTALGAPTVGAHVLDELWVDSNTAQFRCTVAGTPGTWVQMRPGVFNAAPGVTLPTSYWFTRADLGFSMFVESGGSQVLIGGGTAGVIVVAGTTLTLTPAHAGYDVVFSSSSPVTVTVPSTLAVGFQCRMIRAGTGSVTLAAGSGATVHSSTAGLALGAQYLVSAFVVYATATSILGPSGAAAALNVGTSAGTVSAGDDSRIVGAEQSANKNAANGYCPLDSSSKVPTANLPAAVLGGVNYQGTWNATTNSPTIPTAASGNKGYYYRVATSGTTTIDGISDWVVGDWIISNGTTWEKVDNTDLVTSVAGRIGTILLYVADITDATANAKSFLLAADYAAMRALLSLVVGTNVQAYNANLAAFAAITGAADKLSYFTGPGAVATTDLTSFGRTLCGLANALAGRAALGLVIGTDVQQFNSNLDAIAAIGTVGADKLPYYTGSTTAGATTLTAFARTLIDDVNAAAMQTTLGLGGAAVLNVGATAGTVAAGDDGRFTDTRVPTDATVSLAKLTSEVLARVNLSVL